MDELKELAARLRGLREDCGYTQEELAAELNIDLQTYQEYEKTGADVPISVIFQISKKFKLDYSEIITGVSSKLNTYQVVRCGEGQITKRYTGYEYRSLAFHYNNRVMQPFVVSLDPSETRTRLSVHEGEEFNYVLKGKISLTIDGKDIILNEGDSIYFNSTIPHGQNCFGDEPAQFLVLIAE